MHLWCIFFIYIFIYILICIFFFSIISNSCSLCLSVDYKFPCSINSSEDNRSFPHCLSSLLPVPVSQILHQLLGFSPRYFGWNFSGTFSFIDRTGVVQRSPQISHRRRLHFFFFSCPEISTSLSSSSSIISLTMIVSSHLQCPMVNCSISSCFSFPGSMPITSIKHSHTSHYNVLSTSYSFS